MILFLLFPALAVAGLFPKLEKAGTGPSCPVVRGSATLKIKEGEWLLPADRITTGANDACDIRFPSEDLLRAGRNTRLRVGAEADTAPETATLLESGSVRVLVKPPEAGKRTGAVKFALRTPNALLKVHGTEFTVKVTGPCETIVWGLDGEVTVEAGASSVKVVRNFRTTVSGCGDAAKAGAPEKYDLKGYLNEINTKSGDYAPLTSSGLSHVLRVRH